MPSWSGAALAFYRSIAITRAPSAPRLALLSLIRKKKWGVRNIIAV